VPEIAPHHPEDAPPSESDNPEKPPDTPLQNPPGDAPSTGWRPGVWLGVDLGEARIGLAVSDPDGILATPLTTLHRPRRDHNAAAQGRDPVVDQDVDAITRIVRERAMVGIVVGLPVTLAGTDGPAARTARAFAQRLAGSVPGVPVLLADERMSTVVAGRRLAERGVRGPRRRAVVDQAAAVEILQGWLDAQRRRP
jgi:putative pre-16S rRNA nuclease